MFGSPLHQALGLCLDRKGWFWQQVNSGVPGLFSVLAEGCAAVSQRRRHKEEMDGVGGPTGAVVGHQTCSWCQGLSLQVRHKINVGICSFRSSVETQFCCLASLHHHEIQGKKIDIFKNALDGVALGWKVLPFLYL